MPRCPPTTRSAPSQKWSWAARSTSIGSPDDGSSDATADRATAAGAHVIHHEWNAGYGAALRTCFETAREIGADRMVIIDADGQHDPDEIPKLLLPLDRGVDLVIGSRFCNGNGQEIPAYRKFEMRSHYYKIKRRRIN